MDDKHDLEEVRTCLVIEPRVDATIVPSFPAARNTVIQGRHALALEKAGATHQWPVLAGTFCNLDNRVGAAPSIYVNVWEVISGSIKSTTYSNKAER
jgi:hypothetical protein